MKAVTLRKRRPFNRALPLTAALPILAAVLATPLKAVAGSDVDLSAHEHGVAHLALAQEGHEVSVSFNAAANSVLGFEHAPSNAKEQAALEQAQELFQHPERWLQFPVSCDLEASEIRLPFLNAASGEDHDDHKDDEHEHHDGHDDHKADHDHEHEHDDEHKDEHGHDDHKAEHDHDHEAGHVNVEASYTFHCAGDALSPVSLKLFSQLPYLELLRIEAVSERTVVVSEREGDSSLEW